MGLGRKVARRFDISGMLGAAMGLGLLVAAAAPTAALLGAPNEGVASSVVRSALAASGAALGFGSQ